MVDFEELTPQFYNAVVTSKGVQFGERFVGQRLTIDSSFPPFEFDVLSLLPSAPLTVKVGLLDQNVFVGTILSQVLIGLSPLAALPPPDPNIVHGVGEGSVAMLFPAPVSAFGFRLSGGHFEPPNTMFLDVRRRSPAVRLRRRASSACTRATVEHCPRRYWTISRPSRLGAPL